MLGRRVLAASSGVRAAAGVWGRQRGVSTTGAVLAKVGKHPVMFPVRVVASDGSTYEIASTLPMTTLKLNDDRFSHPEFTEGKEMSDAKRGGRIGRFLSRFQSFDMDADAKAPPADAKAPPAADPSSSSS